MSAAAEVAFESHGDIVVACIAGEIDRSNAGDIAMASLDAVPNVAAALVLDLSRTTYLDSSGLQLLFDVNNRLRRRQLQLRVALPSNAPIRRVLSVVAFDRTVPVHETVEEALAAVRDSG